MNKIIYRGNRKMTKFFIFLVSIIGNQLRFKINKTKQILLGAVAVLFLYGNEGWGFSLEKTHQLSICTLFKNEATYLKEWIEYHRLVGVDHFYLYNNGSNDLYYKVLSPYIQQGVVTLIEWPNFIPGENEECPYIWALTTQISAYENALKVVAGPETKWLAFLEVNDFLVPSAVDNLIEILNYYDVYSGIDLLENFFDTSGLNFIEKRALIENLELTLPPKKVIDHCFCKMIVKPDLCKGFLWPPYRCIFKDEEEIHVLAKSELRINHYCKYEDSFVTNKSQPSLQVDYRALSEAELTELLTANYRIEDQERLIYRFLPELRKRMGYDLGWYAKRN